MSSAGAPTGRPSAEAAGGRVASLFDTNGRMVLGLCRYLLRDADEADDATQQTFLSAYRSLLAGTEPRNPAPWLAEIARNECRGRIAARMRATLPLEATIESDDYDPVDAAGQTELLDELKAAIAELPDRQREALVLRDFYGLSYREVATAMTVSVPAVESLLFRARRRLSRRLGTLPRLAQGALTLPLALRDELGRAIPGFDSAAAELGLTGGGAAAGGIVAKLVSLPATAKVATATTVTAVAVGGVAVTPPAIERHRQSSTPPSATKKPATAQSSSAKPRRSTLVREEQTGAVVQIARRVSKAPRKREAAPAQDADSTEVERDDDLDATRTQGRRTQARETTAELESEPADDDADDAGPALPPRPRRSGPPPSPQREAGEAEADDRERNAEDAEPAPEPEEEEASD